MAINKGSQKTPNLRFKGFTDDWEQRKLGEYTKYRRGSFPQPYGNKEWYGGENAMPFVQVVDVSNNLKLEPKTKQNISSIAQSKSVFVSSGTVVVTLQGSIGRVAITQYDSYVDRTLLIFEDYERKTDKYFWGYTIQNKFNIEKEKAPGGTIKTITKAALSQFVVSIPPYDEQSKIGTFLKNIDKTITLHQRKLDQLNQLKEALLQQMFPGKGETVPKLRFAGFEGDWEERKLKNIANYRNGKAHEQVEDKEGSYTIINSKFISTDGKVKRHTNKQVEPMFTGELAIVLSDLPNGKALSKVFLINKDGKYTLNQRVAGITPNENINSKFLKYRMNRHKYFLKFDSGVSQTNLSKPEVENFVASYPCLEEQDKIGNLLSFVDNTITLQQRKLEQLQNTKQVLLQNMFV